MINKLHLAGAVLGSILAVCVAGAQTRGGGVSGRMSSAAVRPMARFSGSSPARFATGATAVRPATAFRISSSGHVVSGFTPFGYTAGNGGGIGVPGLGFDYPHLAAISGSLRGESGRGFERRRHSGQGYIVPIFYGGYPYYPYYYDSSLDYDEPEQQDQQQPYQAQPYPPEQQPQIIVIQEPVPAAAQQAVDPQGSDAGNDAGQSAVLPRAPEAPAPSVGELVLIRKDGQVLFATAFTVVGNQLRYVTTEGILRKFPVAELDSDATQQMNEARGNPVQIN